MEIRNNSFNKLPDENLVHICLFVAEDVEEIVSLRLVSKRWLNISNTVINDKLKMFARANLQSLFNAKWITDEEKQSFFKSKVENALEVLSEEPLPKRVQVLLQRARVARHIRGSLSVESEHNLFSRCLLGLKDGDFKQQEVNKVKEQLKTLVIIGLNPNWLRFAENNQEDEIVECLAVGANIDAQDKEGWTPLHRAVMDGEVAIISELLKAGANIDAQDKRGWTPLHRAVIAVGKVAVTLKLLKSGANIDAQDKEGWTPLHRAVMDGEVAIISELLKAGANIDAQDKKGWTPLHWTVITVGKVAVTLKLLKSGANIDAQDKAGRTPLHFAARWNNSNHISELLKAGANIHVKNNIGITPEDFIEKRVFKKK